MHLRMHTKCIQNAYKHKKREILLLLLLYIVCSSISYCPRLRAFIFYCSHPQAFTDPIKLHCPFFRSAGRMRVPRDAYSRPYRTCDAYGKTDIVRGRE